MNPNVEQMTLFDFLGDPQEPLDVAVPTVAESKEGSDPIEAADEPTVASLPEQERKSVLAIEQPPKEFDGIRIGSVCEIIAEDPRRERLPHLFTETQVGRRIVVTQLSIDRGSRWAWGYRAQLRQPPPGTEKRSKRLEYDPSCSVAPYPAEWLSPLDADTAKLTMRLLEDE